MKKILTTLALALISLVGLAQDEALVSLATGMTQKNKIGAYFPETDTGYILDGGKFSATQIGELAKSPMRFILIDMETKQEVNGKYKPYYYYAVIEGLLEELQVTNVHFRTAMYHGNRKIRKTAKQYTDCYTFYWKWDQEIKDYLCELSMAALKAERQEKAEKERQDFENSIFHLN